MERVMKNAIATVTFHLNIPESEVAKILGRSMVKPDDGTDAWHESACGAVEAAIQDDLRTYLEYGTEPDVEVDA
jgi:hypothetical protein